MNQARGTFIKNIASGYQLLNENDIFSDYTIENVVLPIITEKYVDTMSIYIKIDILAGFSLHCYKVKINNNLDELCNNIRKLISPTTRI